MEEKQSKTQRFFKSEAPLYFIIIACMAYIITTAFTFTDYKSQCNEHWEEQINQYKEKIKDHCPLIDSGKLRTPTYNFTQDFRLPQVEIASP